VSKFIESGIKFNCAFCAKYYNSEWFVEVINVLPWTWYDETLSLIKFYNRFLYFCCLFRIVFHLHVVIFVYYALLLIMYCYTVSVEFNSSAFVTEMIEWPDVGGSLHRFGWPLVFPILCSFPCSITSVILLWKYDSWIYPPCGQVVQLLLNILEIPTVSHLRSYCRAWLSVATWWPWSPWHGWSAM